MKTVKRVISIFLVLGVSVFIPFLSYTIGFKTGFNKMGGICDKSMCQIIGVKHRCQSKPEFENIYRFWEY